MSWTVIGEAKSVAQELWDAGADPANLNDMMVILSKRKAPSYQKDETFAMLVDAAMGDLCSQTFG
jgi:hypothetical protein